MNLQAHMQHMLAVSDQEGYWRGGEGKQEASHRGRPCKKLPWSRVSSIHPLEIVQHSSPPGLKRSPDLLLKSSICLPTFTGPFHSLLLFLGMVSPKSIRQNLYLLKDKRVAKFFHWTCCRATASFNQLRLGFASFTIFLSQLLKLIFSFHSTKK